VKRVSQTIAEHGLPVFAAIRNELSNRATLGANNEGSSLDSRDAKRRKLEEGGKAGGGASATVKIDQSEMNSVERLIKDSVLKRLCFNFEDFLLLIPSYGKADRNDPIFVSRVTEILYAYYRLIWSTEVRYRSLRGGCCSGPRQFTFFYVINILRRLYLISYP